MFRTLRHLLLSLAQFLMNYLAFGRNGKKQKKHVSVELHL
jgi:hypothetical protein